jgi:hypothetical protein
MNLPIGGWFRKGESTFNPDRRRPGKGRILFPADNLSGAMPFQV